MKCITVIGDIEDSRQVSGRASVQERLNEVLKQLNTESDRYEIASPFTITLGDEFQAVFSGAEHLWESLFIIECQLHPVKVRFSVGCGELVTPINTERAIGMDGEAFYRARDGIERLKKSGHLYQVTGLPAEVSVLAENSLNLISEQRRKWNLNRLMIFRYLLSGYPVKKITPMVDLQGQSGVYKNIDDGALMPIANILGDLSDKLNRMISTQ